MKKCGWIKSEKSGKGCPFGLPIAEGCKHAGEAILHMCPLEMIDEDKKEDVVKANKRVYIYYKNNERCLYAADIIDMTNSTNCNWGDTAQGLHMSKAPAGSPLYPQSWNGCGLDGLYAYPLGWYQDNNESRNLFQGLFSLVGNVDYEIIKQARLESPEFQDIISKIEKNENLTTDERNILELTLRDGRQEYEEGVINPAKLKEISIKDKMK